MEEKLQKARAAKNGSSGGRKLMVVNHNPDGSVLTDTVEGECRDTGRYMMSEDDILAMMDSFFENKIAGYKSLTLMHNETIKDLREVNESYKATIESLSTGLNKLHQTVEDIKQVITVFSTVIQSLAPNPAPVQPPEPTGPAEEVVSPQQIVVTEELPHFEGILKYDHPENNHSEMIAITPEMVNPSEAPAVIENTPILTELPNPIKEDPIIPIVEVHLPPAEIVVSKEEPSVGSSTIVLLNAPNVKPSTEFKSEYATLQLPAVAPPPVPLQPAPVPIGIIQPPPVSPTVVVPIVYPGQQPLPVIPFPSLPGLPQQHTGPIVVPNYSPMVFAQPK